MVIDGRKHVLRLLGDAFAGRVARDDAREIDGVAMEIVTMLRARSGFAAIDLQRLFNQNR
jgi:hypothetical protein